MIGYLIDPTTKTVTEVETDGELADIYKHTRCTTIDLARLPDGDGVYLDDEGLLNGAAHKLGMFEVKGYMHPLAGYGLVLGHGADGESAPPRMSLADLRDMVSFPHIDEVITRARNGEFD